jgi:Rad3-related DNA helicase
MVYLRRYFDATGGECGKYALLIDEAHNLADRATDMYSVTLAHSAVRAALEILPTGQETSLADALGALSEEMRRMRELCQEARETDAEGIEHGYYLNHAAPEAFFRLAEKTLECLEQRLRVVRDADWSIPCELLATCLRRFVCIAEHYDARFLTFLALCGEELTVRLSCLDPSEVLGEGLDRARAAVLFSATLTPSDYFVDILGGGKDAVRLSLPSPFPRENCAVLAVPTVSTRYGDRKASYKKLASIIAATVSANVIPTFHLSWIWYNSCI